MYVIFNVGEEMLTNKHPNYITLTQILNIKGPRSSQKYKINGELDCKFRVLRTWYVASPHLDQGENSPGDGVAPDQEGDEESFGPSQFRLEWPSDDIVTIVRDARVGHARPDAR